MLQTRQAHITWRVKERIIFYVIERAYNRCFFSCDSRHDTIRYSTLTVPLYPGDYMSIIRLFDNARETSQEAEKVTNLSCE